MRSTFLLLLLAVPAAGLEPYLVKDINPMATPGESTPAGFAAAGNVALFDAWDGVSERVLWRSDGTPEGTWQLDGEGGLRGVARIGDRHIVLGRSLWATDGTSMVRLTEEGVDIASRPAWVPEQDVVYFVADRELWRTDGTPAGTRLAAHVPDPANLTAFQGRVWFAAQGALWRSDGTRTDLVKKVSPRLLRVVGKRLTFVAPGEELWATDGTSRGTAVLTRFGATFLDSVVVGARLYFTADSPRQGQELWVSDGTAGGTRALTHFARREAFYAPLESMYLPLPRSAPGRFVFVAHDGVHGPEPWVTDGTPKGTRLLRDLCPGECRGVDTVWLTHRGLLYMTATDGARGYEPWVTDGTEKGTRLVRDICRGSCESIASSFLVLGDRVLFAAHDGRNGFELWATDGTASVRLSDFVPEHPWISLHGAVLPGKLLFGAGELWVTDGTPAGTQLVRDLTEIDVGGSFLSGLRELNGEALFFADDGVHGYELWKSDGTEAGTALVAELEPGEEPLEPPFVIASAVAGGSLFLSLERAGFVSLWRTDGTGPGTRKVADVGASEMVSFQGKVWFTVENELWVTDGIGVSRVPGIPHGLSHLTLHQDRLWFIAGGDLWSSDGKEVDLAVELGTSVHFLAPLGEDLIVSGGMLWATDGTPAGTRTLGPAGLGPWTVFQGRLYYASSQSLWVTDGTPQGTELLPGLPAPSAFAVLGDRLLFTTSLPGAPLWEWDGTERSASATWPRAGEVTGSCSRWGRGSFSWPETPTPAWSCGPWRTHERGRADRRRRAVPGAGRRAHPAAPGIERGGLGPARGGLLDRQGRRGSPAGHGGPAALPRPRWPFTRATG